MRKGGFLLRLPISEKNLRDNRAAHIEARFLRILFFLFCRLDLGGGSGDSGMEEVRGLFVDYLPHKKNLRHKKAANIEAHFLRIHFFILQVTFRW